MSRYFFKKFLWTIILKLIARFTSKVILGATYGSERLFDKQAVSWDESLAGYRPHPKYILKSLRLRPGEDVLEIGCGSGWLMVNKHHGVIKYRRTAVGF
jgi:hypothetical protein